MLHVLPYAIPKFGVAKVYLAFLMLTKAIFRDIIKM